jgi:hypothetical protein
MAKHKLGIPMKMNRAVLGLLLVAAVLAQGCVIGFPPLVNVESKESKNENKEMMKRLDSIDKRLSQLEHPQEPEKKP